MTINLVNPDDLNKFISELAEGDERLARYLQIALYRPILKEENFFAPQTTYPENPPIWLTPEKFIESSFSFFDRTKAPPFMEILNHFKDWVKSAIANNDEWLKKTDGLGRPRKLLNIGSLAVAKNIADKDMAQKAGILRSKFLNVSAAFDAEENAGHIQTVKIFEDGERLVRLLTAHALDIESTKLGHCIGNGAYDERLEHPNLAYYSLRDQLNNPHVTLELSDSSIWQIKGKQNAPPIKQYMDRILYEVLPDLGWHPIDNPYETGVYIADSNFHQMRDLPADLTLQGTLGLVKAGWLTHIPERLTVTDTLLLSQCSSLTQIGAGLTAEKVQIDACPKLEGSFDNSKIKEIMIMGSPLLQRLGDNISGHEATIYHSKLNRLGNGITFEKLALDNCSVTFLGKNITVNDISISMIKELVSIGEDCNFKKARISDCNSLEYLGTNLFFEELILDDCIELTHLGENISFGRLFIHNCPNLNKLPDNFYAEKIFWNREEFDNVADFRVAFEKFHHNQDPDKIQLREEFKEAKKEGFNISKIISWFKNVSNSSKDRSGPQP